MKDLEQGLLLLHGGHRDVHLALARGFGCQELTLDGKLVLRKS